MKFWSNPAAAFTSCKGDPHKVMEFCGGNSTYKIMIVSSIRKISAEIFADEVQNDWRIRYNFCGKVTDKGTGQDL
jgi:hypothetical protein